MGWGRGLGAGGGGSVYDRLVASGYGGPIRREIQGSHYQMS